MGNVWVLLQSGLQCIRDEAARVATAIRGLPKGRLQQPHMQNGLSSRDLNLPKLAAILQGLKPTRSVSSRNVIHSVKQIGLFLDATGVGRTNSARPSRRSISK